MGNGSLVIEWDPPYTAINNNGTSVIHVDPHIIQYTVYIIDNYTGNYMDEVNTTEETFSRNTPDVHSCPVYGVTAWNSGGEGQMSPPLPGGKLTFCIHVCSVFIGYCHKLTIYNHFHITVPNRIAAEDVDTHTVSGVLHIHIHVSYN